MTLNGRLFSLRHFLKNNLEAFKPEEEINTLDISSGPIEDEMFIGSVFCSDLSGGLRILVNNQQKLNIKMLNERLGVAPNHE